MNRKNAKAPVPTKGSPFDRLDTATTIERNHFQFKSLSSWACNISMGCVHACRFCYVPEVSTIKQANLLKQYGVSDPDAEWGQYSLLRAWDEKKFLASLRKAENTPLSDLDPDGNRAVIYCSTTDPYQTFAGPNPEKNKLLNHARRELVRRSLELILEKSTLNVRILTRSPLAKRDFDLYKRFGPRLVFGMSLPTLNNKLAKIYEPKAPNPGMRLETLQEAKKAGLHVYVAMAPTYADCDEADLRNTLTAIKELEPITVFHEPINIRAENVQRIREHAKTLGLDINTEVFADPNQWRHYAIKQLMQVQNIARELGVENRLHLWPDKDLRSEAQFLKIRKQTYHKLHPHATVYEKKRAQEADIAAYQDFLRWIKGWHSRISEWPRE